MYNLKVATIQTENKQVNIWTLALPLLIQSLLSSLINTTGITVLTGYSEAFVTATTISGQILLIPRTVLDSIITGTVILSSVSFGKKDRKSAAAISGCGIFLVLVLSVISGVVMGIFAKQEVALMNLKGPTADLTAHLHRQRRGNRHQHRQSEDKHQALHEVAHKTPLAGAVIRVIGVAAVIAPSVIIASVIAARKGTCRDLHLGTAAPGTAKGASPAAAEAATKGAASTSTG